MWFKRKQQEVSKQEKQFDSTDDALRDDEGFVKEIHSLGETMEEYFKIHPEARNEPWIKHVGRIKEMNDARNHDKVKDYHVGQG